MKKFTSIAISLLLMLCLCFTLVACNNDEQNAPPTPPNGKAEPNGGFMNPGDMLGGHLFR